MTWFHTHLRSELAKLSAYVPEGHPGIRIRLDANEAPATESFADIVAEELAGLSLGRYPDAQSLRLRTELARKAETSLESILVGAGSDEVIAILCTALGAPEPLGKAKVLVPSPTFVMYEVTAKTHGLEVIQVPLDDHWDLDVSTFLRAITDQRPRLIFLACPNNPTANRFSKDRVEAILEAAGHTSSFVVLDEAYGDFSEGSWRTLRNRFPHLGILRTLSKIGLAALRVGWLEADPAFVAELDKVRQPFNVSALSQAIATGVLARGWERVEQMVGCVRGEREVLTREISRLPGLRVFPSEANFLWVQTERSAETVFRGLLREGILVRSFHSKGGRLAHLLRITVGAPEENQQLLEALHRLRE